MSLPPNYPPQGGYNPQPGNYGMPPKKSNPWPWILGLGCGIPLVLFLGCVGVVGKVVGTNPEVKQKMEELQRVQKAAGNTTSAAPGTFKYDESTFEMKPTSLGQSITGTVMNTSDNTISYVEIKFALLDANGAQVGTTLTNTSDLQPHAAWKFNASFSDRNVAKWKVLGVDSRPF